MKDKFDNKKKIWKFANFNIEVYLEPFDGGAMFEIKPADYLKTGKYANSAILTVNDNVEFMFEALNYYKVIENE